MSVYLSALHQPGEPPIFPNDAPVGSIGQDEQTGTTYVFTRDAEWVAAPLDPTRAALVEEMAARVDPESFLGPPVSVPPPAPADDKLAEIERAAEWLLMDTTYEHQRIAARDTLALVAEVRSLRARVPLAESRTIDALRSMLMMHDDEHLHRRNGDLGDYDRDPDQDDNECRECEERWPCYVERAREIVAEYAAVRSRPGAPEATFGLRCNECGTEVVGKTGDGWEAIAGWEFTSETGWLCPEHVWPRSQPGAPKETTDGN